MTIRAVTNWRNQAIGSTLFLCCALLLLTGFSASHADDGADKANSLLDNLKQRSAEERWQRIKKTYPTTPARLPENGQQAVTSDEVPPSPQKAQLIPRLMPAPVDTSSDWLITARDPAVLAELQTDPKVDGTLPAVPPAATTTIPVPSSGSQEEQMKTGPTGDVIVGTSRPLRERKIADIDPFYDRDKDKDIREFAVEKGKEFGILFQPKPYYDRSFPEIVLAWEATNFHYHPLYFADSALERYGHAHCPIVQPFASIARFGTQVVFLPYQMTIDPIFKAEYPLGYYRPGDCIPKLHYQVPLNAQAALVEAGFISGLFFIIQ